MVAAITGLMLEQLASGRADFGRDVMWPALERLFAQLSATGLRAPSLRAARAGASA